MNKLLFSVFLSGIIINSCTGMDIIKKTAREYYETATKSLQPALITKTEQFTQTPINPTADTVEAHTCSVLNALLHDLSTKKINIRNVESCKIQMHPSKENRSKVKEILERKYPNFKGKTFIEYNENLPKGCHVVLEALIKYHYKPHDRTPKKAKL